MAKETKEQVASESVVSEQPAPEPATKEQLMAEMQAAMKSGDWKLVSQVSRKIDIMTKAVEKAELDAKRAASEAVGKKVLGIFLSGVKPLVEAGELDPFDGIWIAYDFGEQQPSCRLMKSTAKAPRAGGGGTGKKFDVSTDAMLAKYGAEPYKESGQTFQAAYEGNTDKNFRYAIRQALLKKENII